MSNEVALDWGVISMQPLGFDIVSTRQEAAWTTTRTSFVTSILLLSAGAAEIAEKGPKSKRKRGRSKGRHYKAGHPEQ